MDTFGSRIRALREARGWSQEKLGFEFEVGAAAISKWELGRAEPSLGQLEVFLQVFAREGVTLEWLVRGEKSSAGAKKQKKSSKPSPRLIESQDEMALLARYRRLSSKKQTALLGLLED